MKTRTYRLSFLALLGGVAAFAWQLPPEPPAPPAPAVMAMPAPAPVAPVAPAAPAAPMPAAAPQAPVPPRPPDWELYAQDWQDKAEEMAQKAQEMVLQNQDKIWDAQEKAQELREKMLLNQDQFKFQADAVAKAFASTNLNIAPFAYQVGRGAATMKFGGRVTNVDALYERGRRELDRSEWEQAANDFKEVATRAASHADGALYWQAYAENKMGKRDEALASIANLRKTYASSRWLDDANALEVEVKQGSGGAVAPDSTSDDEIKLLALNGLMQSDPDRAFPYLDKLLKSASSPHLKEQTLFVLAQSESPKAQQALIQIAKGGANPDLQLKAIRYLGATNRRQGNNNQTLFDIYNSSNDTAVKREILNALAGARDTNHVLEIARNEKNHDLQLEAIRRLAGMNREGRGPNANTSTNTNTGDLLGQLYGSAAEKDTKREIVNDLAGMRDAKALVDIGRKEKDLEMKRYIVERVMNMNTPESKQFLEEILK